MFCLALCLHVTEVVFIIVEGIPNLCRKALDELSAHGH